MKTDELRRSLDDLAGDPPSVDDALAAVARRASRDRLRNRAGALSVVAVVAVAVAAFGVIRHSSTPEHVIVRNPTAPAAGNVADFSWTRGPAPQSRTTRIVTANGHTYLLGGSKTGAVIEELSADGSSHTLFDVPYPAGINDLISVNGALVAVGYDRNGAAAWRSTDIGATWPAIGVEQPPADVAPPSTGTGNAAPARSLDPQDLASMNRIFSEHGTLYAVGVPAAWSGSARCEPSVWTSTDGTSFTLAPAGVACGSTDAADGPAGIVSVASSQALFAGSAPVAISPDGGVQVNAIAGDDHGYVAVGEDPATTTRATGAIWWSRDSKNWTREVTAADPDPKGFELFSDVAHSPSGWIAVGYRGHPNANVDALDAVVWTSTDGEHWTEFSRDSGVFEQFAGANGVGVTNDGVAIWGTANITGSYTTADPGGSDYVLWLGSSVAPNPPLGIVEGRMAEVGGPAPGLARGIAGTLVATSADGHQITAATAAGGRFSTELPPGSYTIVGRSPQYQNNQFTCPGRYEGGDAVGDTIVIRANHVAHVELVCNVR